MGLSLTDKVAVVTGASRGIGAAIARELAARGAKVVVNYRANEDAAAAVVRAIHEAGGVAAAIQADLSQAPSIERLFQRAAQTYGRLDVLVNNAAAVAVRPLDAIDEPHLDELLALNIKGTVLASREAARLFGEGGGRIINISSLNGRIASPRVSIYAATKAALESLTRSHAIELGPRGITVNAVAPGLTETDMLAGVTPREAWGQLAAITALGRVGRPEDIASVVAFLASDDARWVTGQVIGADGGVRAF